MGDARNGPGAGRLLEDRPGPHAEQVEQFIERVAEYKATVHRVTTDGPARRNRRVVAARGVQSLVVPADLPEGWAPGGV